MVIYLAPCIGNALTVCVSDEYCDAIYNGCAKCPSNTVPDADKTYCFNRTSYPASVSKFEILRIEFDSI